MTLFYKALGCASLPLAKPSGPKYCFPHEVAAHRYSLSWPKSFRGCFARETERRHISNSWCWDLEENLKSQTNALVDEARLALPAPANRSQPWPGSAGTCQSKQMLWMEGLSTAWENHRKGPVVPFSTWISLVTWKTLWREAKGLSTGFQNSRGFQLQGTNIYQRQLFLLLV